MPSVASLPTPECRVERTSIDLITSLEALKAALVEMGAAPQSETVSQLAEVRRAVAAEFTKVDRRAAQDPAVTLALDCICEMSRRGVLDLPLTAKDHKHLVKWQDLGWPGLVASMMLTAAWRWNTAPLFSEVPDWLWSSYAEWLFAAPSSLASEADTAAYAAHVGRHSEELARWVQRNIGSAAVRGAVEVFARHAPLHPLRFTATNMRLAAESRRKILRRLNGRTAGSFEPVVSPRSGRTLRIGFLARQWDADPDTCAALAQFEHLPTERFVRILFSLREPATAFGWHCRERAQEFHILTGDLAAQAGQMREANLDVMLFVGDTTLADDFGRLATLRVAALQAVDGTNAAADAVEADLCLMPSELATPWPPSRGTQRLGLLPAGATSFALRRGGDADLSYAREDLGFPPDTLVLVAVLGSTHGTLETLVTCGRVLVRAPEARLVVHVRPDPELTPVGFDRFCTIACAVMDELGVANDRVSILAPEAVMIEETRAIVRLADVLLATRGGDAWAAEALAAGIPVLTGPGTVAEWLKAEKLPELVASDPDGLVDRAVALIGNPGWRFAVRAKVKSAAEAGLPGLDTLASADGFVGVVETAYDQLEALGRSRFLRQPNPVQAGTADDVSTALSAAHAVLDAGGMYGAADAAHRALTIRPRDPRIRALYGRALAEEGNADRGAEYLVAAVQQLPCDANLWFALASALKSAGRSAEAIQALETSLRLDQGRPDAWLMLIELAEAVAHLDLAREAYQALKEAAPDHPQLAELGERYAS